MKTTWYLHVHFVWLKLSNSSIVEGLSVCLAAHGENFFDGHCRKRQTSTASPAKPGDLPAGLGPDPQSDTGPLPPRAASAARSRCPRAATGTNDGSPALHLDQALG